MIFKRKKEGSLFKRKKEKAFFGQNKEISKQNIIDNLKLCRLEGDLLAVEAAIRDRAPKSAPISDDGSTIKRIMNGMSGIITEIGNAARTFTVRELSVDKERAREAINRFRDEHKDSDLSLSENISEFRKYIDKSMFKADKDELGRIAFALVFAIDDRNTEYQCPEESLEVVSEILFDSPKRLGNLYTMYKNNFAKISKPFGGEFESGLGIGATLGGALALSLMPISVTGVAALIGYLLNKKATAETLKTMSPGEMSATLAYRLTLIEAADFVDEGKRKEMIDELLEDIGNIRSDAEYKRFVEGCSIPESRDKIQTCDLTLARLGKILGV